MKPLAACIAFVFTAVTTGVLLSFITNGLTPAVAVFSLSLGVAVAAFAWPGTRDVPREKFGIWDGVALGVFALISLRAFFWLIYFRADELCVLSPNNLGDMSLHLNFIRYFASGVPFWPESPILTGTPLTYPLGADFFNSLFEICGVDTIGTLVWAGLAGAAMTGFALWRWGGAFGLAAFMFNGGLVGFSAFRTLAAEDFQSTLIWKNLFLSMFVTQRGLLFALPAGLVILIGLRERFFRSGRMIVPWWLQLLLYVAMPLFNLHAFLFFSAMLFAVFATLVLQRRKSDWVPLGIFAGLAVIPATCFILMVTGAFSTQSGLGWMEHGTIMGGEKSLAVWVRNFGLSLPLVLILVAFTFFRKECRDAETRCFVWCAFAVFAAATVYKFAPWEWDNTKLMMWGWLVMAPYLWSKIIGHLNVASRTAICALLFLSGAISLYAGLDTRHGYGIGRRSEIDSWRKAIAGIPATDRFACVPDYNHPLILLGRKVACGYEGHLWSHGLNYQSKLRLLKSALAGQTPWQTAAPELNVQWLGLRSRDVPPAQPPQALSPGALGAIFDLKPSPASQSLPPPRPQSVDLSW